MADEKKHETTESQVVREKKSLTGIGKLRPLTEPAPETDKETGGSDSDQSDADKPSSGN